VRMDMNMKLSEQIQMQGTLHDFQWDVPVAAREFASVIPADYTPGPGDGVKMPAMTEETEYHNPGTGRAGVREEPDAGGPEIP
jgi:hypothetical protein